MRSTSGWRRLGIGWVRYADDFLLLCETRAEAEAALGVARDALAAMGLSLSPEKNEELVVGDADLRARQRRDDAGRDRLAHAERIADGQHEVADLERVRIAKLERGNGPAPLSLSTARSVRGSRSTMSAASSRRSASDTLTSVMFSMTWLLVTTKPAGSTMTPEPSDRWTRSCGPHFPPPKKRRKKGSSISGLRAASRPAVA